jgi:hypothetical protein
MCTFEHLFDCLKIGFTMFSHCLIDTHSINQVICYVIFKQAHQGRVALKAEEPINTESVHVVIYLNDFLSLWGPELFNFFSKDEGVFLAEVRVACLQHMFWVDQRSKSEDQLLQINASL